MASEPRLITQDELIWEAAERAKNRDGLTLAAFVGEACWEKFYADDRKKLEHLVFNRRAPRE